jgi:hypothetical protein
MTTDLERAVEGLKQDLYENNDDRELCSILADACEELGDICQSCFWRWCFKQGRRPYVTGRVYWGKAIAWKVTNARRNNRIFRSYLPECLYRKWVEIPNEETRYWDGPGEKAAAEAWSQLYRAWRSLWEAGVLGEGRDPDWPEAPHPVNSAEEGGP